MFGNTMVALVTPMLPGGEIDYPALQRLLDFHLTAGTEGLVILGSTGEGWAVSSAVREQIVRTVVAYVDGRIPVIVGVGTNATQTTITAAQQLEALGIDGVLTICPYYNKPMQEGIYKHFIELANALSTPIILYNHPGRTGVDMQPETVARLATHENIVAVKEAVVDATRFAELGKLVNEGFSLYSGDDASCLQLIQAGGKGLISVAANIIPAQMSAMVQAAVEGDLSMATDLQQALMPIFVALNIESNPIPLKWVLAEMGYIENVLCLPLTPLTAANTIAVADVLVNMGLIKKDNNNAKIA